jgi:hypothetical protein
VSHLISSDRRLRFHNPFARPDVPFERHVYRHAVDRLGPRAIERPGYVKRTALVLVIALLAVPAVWVPPAQACSCALSDPRDDLHAADGAFIGTYVGREPTDPTDPVAAYDYIFDTDEVFKGAVGDVVRVRAPANGAGCGLEYREGATAALFLDRQGEQWRSNLCMTVAPDHLEEAAAPFPQPNAKGPPRLLIGGSFGEVRVIALDKGGRTAGYGYGDGDALLLSLCPGGKTSIEVVGSFGSSHLFVDVRRVSDLSVTMTIATPARPDDQSVYPLEARCVSADGDTVVFVRGFDANSEFSELLLFAGSGTSTIHKGKLDVAALGRGEAFAADGDDVVEIDYGTGESRAVGSMDRDISQLALSPGGGLVAGVSGAAFGEGDPATAFAMSTDSGDVRARRELSRSEGSALFEWLGSRKLLMFRGGASPLVLDRDLSKRMKIPGWPSLSSVAIGCRIFGSGYGVIARSSICEESAYDVVREFFSPITNVTLKLPRDTSITAPPESGSRGRQTAQ